MSNASVDVFRRELRQTFNAIAAGARFAVATQAALLALAIGNAAPDKSGRLKKSVRLKVAADGLSATVTAGGPEIEGLKVPISRHRLVTLDLEASPLSLVGIHIVHTEHKVGGGRMLAANLGGNPFSSGSGELYDYALATEFGTSKEPARPFFFSTYRTRKHAIRTAIANAMVAPIRALWD